LGSTTLIVDNNGDYKAIDLATGNASAPPAIDLPEAADLQQLLPLGGDKGYVGWVNAGWCILRLGDQRRQRSSDLRGGSESGGGTSEL
jgi:hypothetical protein